VKKSIYIVTMIIGLCFASSVWSAIITGKVTEATDEQVTIVCEGNGAPAVGDKVEIGYVIAGDYIPYETTWKVSRVVGGSVVAKPLQRPPVAPARGDTVKITTTNRARPTSAIANATIANSKNDLVEPKKSLVDSVDVIPKDESVKNFLAAQRGEAQAQRELGWDYQNGKGVEKNLEKAVLWYRKAAEQEHADAQNDMGVMYENGWGVEKDNVQALAWFRKAAERKLAIAQMNIGRFHYYGKGGLQKSFQAAAAWYWKAAENGNAKAQFLFGAMYEKGEGVNEDLGEALAWYKKSAAQGYKEAKNRLVERSGREGIR